MDDIVHEPTVTRHADGHLTIQWPDPPRPWYKFSHQLIQEWVDTYNARLERDHEIVDAALNWADWDGYPQPTPDYEAIIAAVDQRQP